MRALRHLGRSASATLLLGRMSSSDELGHAVAPQEDNTSSQTPLDKTLTKIGFGTYQKKLL